MLYNTKYFTAALDLVLWPEVHNTKKNYYICHLTSVQTENNRNNKKIVSTSQTDCHGSQWEW